MKGLEDILYETGILPEDTISSSTYHAIPVAMESYAEQQAIEFAKWIGKNYTLYKHGWVPNYKRGDIYTDENIILTEQLYQKFKEEQS